MGETLAEGFIQDQLRYDMPFPQQLVVISSPYAFIPTATHEKMILRTVEEYELKNDIYLLYFAEPASPAIEKKGFFGLSKTKEAVDLDGSRILYNENKQGLEVIYFGNLQSNDRSVRHSGDDLTGDVNGDDGLDNEVITVDLSRLNPAVNYIAFVLNSFRGQDFSTIPSASIRIYEGTPTRVTEVFAKYDIANDASFAGSVSMVMGVFYKKNGEWKFNAIRESTRDKKLQETVETVTRQYI